MKMENALNISFLSEENIIANEDIKMLLEYIKSEMRRLQDSDIPNSFKKIILTTLYSKISEFWRSKNLATSHTYLYKGIIPFSTFEFSNYPYVIFYYRFDIINFDDIIKYCNFEDRLPESRSSLIFKDSFKELYARLVGKEGSSEVSFCPFRIINLNEKDLILDESLEEKIVALESMYQELIRWLLNVNIIKFKHELEERSNIDDEKKQSYIDDYYRKIIYWFNEKNRNIQVSIDNYVKYNSMHEKLCNSPEEKLKNNQFVYPGLNEALYIIRNEFKDMKERFKRAYSYCNDKPYLRILFKRSTKF